MATTYDIGALSNYELKGTSVFETLIAAAAFSPYVVRFLVQGIPSPDTFYTSADVTALAELSKAVSVDFDKYAVLGVTVAPTDAGSCVVDVVFNLLEWNTVYVSKDKMGQFAIELLAKRGLTNVNVTVLEYAFLSPNSDLSAKWMTLTPIFQRVSTADILIATQAWKDTVLVGKQSPSFLSGVSTDPGNASPIVIVKAGVLPPAPPAVDPSAGTLPIPSFNIAGMPMSVDKIAVAALMGYLGFRLVKAWRQF